MAPPPTDPFLSAARELLAGLLAQSSDDDSRRAALSELSGWLQVELAARAPRPGEAPAASTSAQSPSPSPLVDLRVEERPLSIGGKTVLVAARVAEETLDPRVPLSLEGRVILPSESVKPRPPLRTRSGTGAGPGPGPRAEEDWPWILERTRNRARLKADACHWALRRHDDPEVTEQAREALWSRSRELGGFSLWPLDRTRPLPDDELLEYCAEAYENLAQAVEVILTTRTWITGAVAPPEELLYLAADVQSALRSALIQVDVHDDPDQIDLFIWIKELGYRHSIYVPRHLRREDPSDPSDWLLRRERLDALGEKLRREGDDRRERKRLVDKLHYQVSRLARAGGESERRMSWSDLLRTLDLWVEGRRPPTSLEVCEPLLAHLDDLPEDLEVPAGAKRVLQAVDDLLAARSQAAHAVGPSAPTPSAEMRAARALLEGKIVVLIGGERRVDEEQRLVRDLGLAELRWRSTRPHRSIDPLIDQISRPDVDLVIVAVRWSDHAFGELRRIAEAAGKPFVQLPGGYGTNQVAHQVLAQASGKLAGEKAY